MDHRDIITDALRALNVVARDEAADGWDYEYAKTRLDALFLELQTSPGMDWSTLTVDTIPEKYRIPLGNLLATDLAPQYNATPPTQRATALIRLRAVQNVYTRDMDLDGDGTTSETEECAFDRGGFF